MALDTTIGGASTDSYVTLAEAATYHTNFNNTAWAALSDLQKEAALREAARFVDGYNYTGTKATLAQARQWPRIDAAQDGFPLASDIIPQLVKDAQCEAALRQSASALQPDVAPGMVTEETVGPITVKYSDNSNNGRPTYPLIDRMLRPLLSAVGGMFQHRLVRT